MELMRGALSSIVCPRSKETDRGLFFLENGSKLLKAHITQLNGRSKIPLRNFSAKELAKATNNFPYPTYPKPFPYDVVVLEDGSYRIYRGSFQDCQILVKKYHSSGPDCGQGVESFIVNDIVISSQMSFHKNALKVIGYCLDFEYPALIYQCPEAYNHLSHRLFYTEELKLTWENRLSIASDIANVLLYLHIGFRTPFILRNMKLGHFVIDKQGTAKLADFSFCIPIPLGECQVEDAVIGTCGYMDPIYCITGVLTEKTDVYNIGVVLVELFTGRKYCDMILSDSSLVGFLRSYTESDDVESIVNADMVIEGGTGQIEQFRAFAALALKCLQEEGDNRPEMVDVAKELRRIQRLACSPSTS